SRSTCRSLRSLVCHCLCTALWRPPVSAIFPYTTLFRSGCRREDAERLLADSARIRHLLRDPHGMRQLLRATHAREGPVEGVESRSEEHTSELQSRFDLLCRLLPEKKKTPGNQPPTTPRN